MIPLLQLAAASPPPDDTVGPGVGGFVVIFALAVATVLLVRSMVGHLRKVRYGPGPDDEPGDRLDQNAPNGESAAPASPASQEPAAGAPGSPQRVEPPAPSDREERKPLSS